MIRLRDAGLSNEEIAENMGCSAQTVSKKFKALDEIADSDNEI
jgi:DNA-binding CsgD family transcriptional regulator